MIISLIVAYGLKREIGFDNKLLWHLPEDLSLFKKYTLDHTILMGRKTFDSIGRILPGRKMVVISKTKKNVNGQVKGQENSSELSFFENIDEAIESIRGGEENELFIIGGESIYKECLKSSHFKIDRLYLSIVEGEFKADCFFPNLDLTQYKLTKKLEFNKNEKNQYSFTHEVWDLI